MKKILIFSLLGLVYLACANVEGESSEAQQASVPSKPDGEKIYKTYCVTCHGLYGDMGASGAHDLTQSELSLEERIEVITNGRNNMTPFKSLLSPEKIKAVAEYTLELKEEE